MSRYLPAPAALNALPAIGFGTFAAHAIPDPQAREWIRTGVTFQLPHAVAVFALLGWQNPGRNRRPPYRPARDQRETSARPARP